MTCLPDCRLETATGPFPGGTIAWTHHATGCPNTTAGATTSPCGIDHGYAAPSAATTIFLSTVPPHCATCRCGS